MPNQTLEELKRGWDDAKKAAASLSLDFKEIEVARKREAEARRQYFKSLAGRAGATN